MASGSEPYEWRIFGLAIILLLCTIDNLYVSDIVTILQSSFTQFGKHMRLLKLRNLAKDHFVLWTEARPLLCLSAMDGQSKQCLVVFCVPILQRMVLC